MENGHANNEGRATLPRVKARSRAVEVNKDGGAGTGSTHRRGLSGGLLSRLSLLRSAHANDTPTSGHGDGQVDGIRDTELDDPEGPRLPHAIQQQKKTRKRKGSLRKTALLGTGRFFSDGRDRRGQLHETSIPRRFGNANGSLVEPPLREVRAVDATGSQQSPVDLGSYGQYSTSQLFSTSSESLTLGSHEPAIPIISPPLGETSTTDEDDLPSARQRMSLPPSAVPLVRRPSAKDDSYFPPQSALPHRRPSSARPKSPLASSPAGLASTPDEWDYSETEWWGWVVLLVTWIVFVVGMGSCLGVWSWAWDVGETPYAPPELEDDPTLPIVGYYPALIILTMVMAWVWVVVAWVGMKYFRHAKLSGEDF